MSTLSPAFLTVPALTLCLSGAFAFPQAAPRVQDSAAQDGAAQNGTATDGPVRADAAAQVDEYLTRLEHLGFHGLVLVASGERVLVERGLGQLDRDAGTAMPNSAVFTTGSVTKQFTAAACARLVGEDRLAFDDPLSKWFDDVPPDKAKLTLHQLLTHTSGLPHGVGDDEENTPRGEFMERLWSAPLSPIGEFSYSNAGYTLAALIVEKVSGESYEAFCRKHLWQPAGMRKTGYVLPRYTAAELAVAHRDGQRWGTVAANALGSGEVTPNLLGNGGVHSTLRDMFAWHRALLGDEIVGASMKQHLFGKHVPFGRARHYAYGWEVGTSARGTDYTYHNGGNDFFSCDYMRYTSDDVVVIVASSDPAFPAPLVTPGITRLVFAGGEIPAPRVAPESAVVRASRTGKFAGQDDATIEVDLAGKALLIRANGPAAAFLRGGNDQPRVARAIEDTTRVLEAAFDGDFGPWARAVGEADVAAAKQEAQGFFGYLEQVHGARKGHRVALASATPMGAEIVVQFEHENAKTAVLFGWAGGGLDMIRPTEVEEGLTLRCHPIGDGVYAAFEIREGVGVQVRFDPDGQGLTLVANERKLTLRRS